MTEELLIDHHTADLSTPVRDEISIAELLGILWRGRILIVVIMVLLAAIFSAVGFLKTRQYEAFITVLPVEGSDSHFAGGAGALLSQVGDLASLAGISAGGDSKRAESIAVLQSEALTERYIKENDLLPVLYKKQWDSQNKTWKITNSGRIPTLWMANQLFKKKVRGVSEDTKTGLVTMRIAWTDPQLAAQWANGLVAMTNEYLRNKEIAESERNIAYLNEEVAKTNVVEVRSAIYATLQSEVKKVMIARGTDEFALRIVDPATAPESPSNPAWWIWLAGGLLAGFFIAVPIVSLRSSRALSP